MILGRPPNLILGAFAAIFNVIVLALSGQGHPLDPSIVAGINIAAAALIGLIAYQPPTLNPGQTFNVTTPAGQPSVVTTVAVPPAADLPPVPVIPAPPLADLPTPKPPVPPVKP